MIELLIVLVVLGIISAMSLRTLRSDRMAVSQAATILAGQISRTRLEAIKSNENAGIWFTVSQTNSTYPNQGGANNAVTSGNFKICVDLDRDLTCDTDETGVHSVEYGKGDLARVKLISGAVAPTAVIFNSRGISVSGSTSVVLSNKDGTYTKTIQINAQGRASIL